jgi:hypothetical protein
VNDMNIHIERPKATFMNISEGSMTIYSQGVTVTDEGARRAVGELRSALATVALDQPAAAEARDHVAKIEAAMQAPQPNKSRVAKVLERLTRLLDAAVSLATASAAIIGPLQALAGWLGHLGVPILGLLPG